MTLKFPCFVSKILLSAFFCFSSMILFSQERWKSPLISGSSKTNTISSLFLKSAYCRQGLEREEVNEK